MYVNMGLGPLMVKSSVSCLVHGGSIKRVYADIIEGGVEPFLKKRYELFMYERSAVYKDRGGVAVHPRVIWFCWLQGYDKAPDLVRACYNALRQNLPQYEVRIVTEENVAQYVELPEHVLDKRRDGSIPAALFSDIIRLELLNKYGGTWLDATVLCAAGNVPGEYLEADLFMFQYSAPGSASGVSISNWFISACAGNPVLLTLRDMLCEYWKEYDLVLDYYIFHFFFNMLAEVFPEELASMPYGYSRKSLGLGHALACPFNERKWAEAIEKVPVQKLCWRVPKAVLEDVGNYYNAILERYLLEKSDQ